MKSNIKEVAALRQYLLGQALLEDSSQVEERLLADSAFYQELLIAEDELVDEYLTAELSESDRESFEAHFLLTPERHQKVRFARNLKRYVNDVGATQPDEPILNDQFPGDARELAEPRSGKRPFFSFLPLGNPIVSYALAAAVLVIVGAVSWVVFQSSRNPTPHEPGKILAVELTSGLTRDDGEIKKIVIPAGTDTVQLELRIATIDQYQSYRAVLQTIEGWEKFKADDLKAATTGTRGFISLQLPNRVLTRGDYYVKLSGLNSRGEYEDVGRYSFRVTSN